MADSTSSKKRQRGHDRSDFEYDWSTGRFAKRFKSTPLNQTLPPQPLAAKQAKLQNDTTIKHLDGKTTVIIGAGFVGLSTALQLATKAKSTATEHNITVLEINNGPCQLASQHCGGLISVSGMNERWAMLDMDYMERWTSWTDASTPGSTSWFEWAKPCEKAREHENVPSWFERGPNYNMAPLRTAGRVDVQRLALWLMEQCKELGVEFVFGAKAVMADQDQKGRISQLHIAHAASDRPFRTLACNSLVIAAGPFTTGIYKRIFPNSLLKMENRVRGVQKLQLRNLDMSEHSAGVMNLAGTAVKADGYTGSLNISTQKGEETAEVWMVEKEVQNGTVQPKHALRHRGGRPEPLLALAAKLLTAGPDGDIDADSISQQSHSFICTGTNRCPVLSKVPAKAFGASDGVFLAYGFGMYGTTLAPIIGDIMTQLVCGDEPQFLDLTDFTIPLPRAPEKMSRRKSNAVASLVAKADRITRTAATPKRRRQALVGAAVGGKAKPSAVAKSKPRNKIKAPAATGVVGTRRTRSRPLLLDTIFEAQDEDIEVNEALLAADSSLHKGTRKTATQIEGDQTGIAGRHGQQLTPKKTRASVSKQGKTPPTRKPASIPADDYPPKSENRSQISLSDVIKLRKATLSQASGGSESDSQGNGFVDPVMESIEAIDLWPSSKTKRTATAAMKPGGRKAKRKTKAVKIKQIDAEQNSTKNNESTEPTVTNPSEQVAGRKTRSQSAAIENGSHIGPNKTWTRATSQVRPS